MKKDGPKVRVTEYRMGLHYGVCHGPVDYISEIRVKDKLAWDGKKRNQDYFVIDKPKRFGGLKKEGGLKGMVSWLPGRGSQTIPDFLAGKVNRTEATMPAYRGIASLWFTENKQSLSGDSMGASRKGFYWSANSPYIPPVAVTVARTPVGLTDAIARIYREHDLVGTEVELDVASFGNRAFKWDTNGDFAVHGQSGDVAEIYDLPSGTRRVSDTAATDSVHLTDDGQLISNLSSNALIFDAATGVLQQTLALGFTPNPNNYVCYDDIVSGSTHYLIGSAHTGAFTRRYFVLSKPSTGGSWSVLWDAACTNFGQDVSAGPTYGYFVEGDYTDAASRIIRVDLASHVESAVTPSGLTDDIACVYYDDASEQVIVVCIDGCLFAYTPNLATLNYSNVTGGYSVPRDGFNGKRMSLAPGILGVVKRNGVSDPSDFKLYDSHTLALFQTVDGSDEGFSDSQPSFAGFNPDYGLAFMGSHFALSYLMFIQGTGVFDANPSHIIYEVLTNKSFGMGAASTAIDVDSFENAAQVLYDERFGISLLWTRQTSHEAFVTEILDHIEATLFLNPSTGLLTLKLIRNDYDAGSLPIYTPDNSTVSRFSRKLWGETINEIIVTYSNAKNGDAITVSAQNGANIAAQGGVVSDSRNYYGVWRKGLAAKLARRDLRVAAAPLASCDIEIDREAWALLPGDVIKIESDDDGVTTMVMRVGQIDYGKPGDPTVKAQLVEDIFALALSEYEDPDESEDEGGGEEDPAPAANSYVFTAPWFFGTWLGGGLDLASAEYPECFAIVMAAQVGSDTAEFELWGDKTDAGGITTVSELTLIAVSGRATLAAGIDAEAETVAATFTTQSDGPEPEVSGFVLISEGDEDDIELALITAVSGSDYTLLRGALDTTPKEWASGTAVWFLGKGQIVSDPTIRAAAEAIDYQLLSVTSAGTLDIADAPVVTETLTERPWLPLRPANVKANGVGFGTSDCDGVNPIPVTWVNRNRLTEDAQVLAWDDATVTGEAGQTTTVYATTIAGTVLATHAGLSGTSYDLDPLDFGAETEGYIKVTAVRDGYESLQGHRVHVTVSGGRVLEDGTTARILEDGATTRVTED